jgi:hypothetical protein
MGQHPFPAVEALQGKPCPHPGISDLFRVKPHRPQFAQLCRQPFKKRGLAASGKACHEDIEFHALFAMILAPFSIQTVKPITD